MNRKDRRAAQSKSKGRPAGAQGLGPGAMSANLFTSAIEHFNAGRMDDAERLCRDVLMFNREHFDALLMLGMIAMRFGNMDAATELFGRALVVNPRSAEGHFALAQAFRRQGRAREAMDHLAETTALKPSHLQAQVAIADMLVEQSQLEAARDRYLQALAVDPRLIEALHGLAHVLRLQGQFAQAAQQFQQVVSLAPNYAEAHNNLGVVLSAQGRWPEAVDAYGRALSLKPDLVDVYRNLGRALHASGRIEEALHVQMQGLALGETDAAKATFVFCAQGAIDRTPLHHNDRFRELVTRALTEGWGRSADLSWLASTLVMGSEAVSTAGRALAGPGGAPDAAGVFGTLSRDRILLALLESAPVRLESLEHLLTKARSNLLQAARATAADATTDASTLAFACALARQCFINEYTFAETATDASAAQALSSSIEGAIAERGPIAPLWVAALGCIRPLHDHPDGLELLNRSWPDALKAVLTQQIQEPAIERDTAGSIQTLTAIDDSISLQVRQQYEEMPYPRWVKPPLVGHTVAIDWYLRSQFPMAPIRPYHSASGLDVLIAGCGTGQHAIETAQRFAGARMLAIDLSRTSLAYAIRKTREARIRNIEYRQADILNLGGLDASFDVIESSGVLHHMADPALGWRILLSLLRPGGFMHIGLYSAIARADVTATRAMIAERGYGTTASEIRRCRQDLYQFPQGTDFRSVTNYTDFFTTSECRDLLFHVQEHQFTIPQIKQLIADTGVTFLGFAGPATQIAHPSLPQGAAQLDLDRWQAYELENPKAFVNMYQFWVQKA